MHLDRRLSYPWLFSHLTLCTGISFPGGKELARAIATTLVQVLQDKRMFRGIPLNFGLERPLLVCHRADFHCLEARVYRLSPLGTPILRDVIVET